MDLTFIKKQIETMDVKSDEFFDLYTTICDKYYTFPDPDDFQQHAMMLRMYVDKAVDNYEEQLIAFGKIVVELFNLDKDGKARMFNLGFKQKEYFITMASDHKEIEKMQEMMGKVLKGDFKIKDKFGKKYF